MCCFSILQSNVFIDSESGVTICNQFLITRLDTGRHQAHVDSTRHIGDHLEQSLYLQPFSRFWPLSVLGLNLLTFQGHGTSSVTWLDFQVAISYRCYIVIKSLSRAVSEIMGTIHIGSQPFDLLGSRHSRDVIGHVTIGLAMGHFLLLVLWTQVSISNGFRDMGDITWYVPGYPYVKFKYIFQFVTPTLPIEFTI